MKAITNPRPNDEKFSYYFDLLLPEIKSRKNLSTSHLMQFKILCDLLVQYDKLKDQIDQEGITLYIATSQGEKVQVNPATTQLNTVTAKIKDYSKMLGLVLEDAEGPVEDPEQDDWC